MQPKGDIFEKAGVWGVTALVAAVVIAYSLWGASVLHAQQGGFSATPAPVLSANL